METHVAFLDVRKAYPTTYRSTIMSKLNDMINKIPGAEANKQSRTWGVIREMYNSVISAIRATTNGEDADSEEYRVDQGLREGSALSPLVYTISINNVIQKMEGVEVGKVLDLDNADLRDLRALLYADAMVLVAASNSDLQKLISKVEENARI